MADSKQIYPILSKPLFKEKIWGGRKLESLLHLPLPPDKKIGEAWLVADLVEGTSSISNGPLAGKSLAQVTKSWGELMIGTGWNGAPTGKRFPLLIKFIDAQNDLSVQVHPDNEAREKYFPKAFSKDESWIILDSESYGRICHGFLTGTNLRLFDQLLEKEKVANCLRSVKVSSGDVIRVSPGTVHALCKGVVILEIQEPSDTTFRIFDYNRIGETGKPRTLHIDESRKVIRFGDNSAPKIQPKKISAPWGDYELLVDVSPYRIERINLNKEKEWLVDPVSAQVLIVLNGKITLQASEENLTVQKGQTVILPAAIGKVTVSPANASALIVLAGKGGVPMVTP